LKKIKEPAHAEFYPDFDAQDDRSLLQVKSKRKFQSWYHSYLGSFNTNYIIFRNVEKIIIIFFSKEKKNIRGKKY
jgi:hypothetical protein